MEILQMLGAFIMVAIVVVVNLWVGLVILNWLF